MCKFRQMLHVRCQRGSDMTSLQIVSLWLPWWIDTIELRRFCISARWSRADTTFSSSLQAWSFIRNVYSLRPFYKMIGATGGSQKSDPSIGGGAGHPDYVPSQVDSNYCFDIYSFCLFGWKKVAGVQRSIGVGMFCWNQNGRYISALPYCWDLAIPFFCMICAPKYCPNLPALCLCCQ